MLSRPAHGVRDDKLHLCFIKCTSSTCCIMQKHMRYADEHYSNTCQWWSSGWFLGFEWAHCHAKWHLESVANTAEASYPSCLIIIRPQLRSWQDVAIATAREQSFLSVSCLSCKPEIATDNFRGAMSTGAGGTCVPPNIGRRSLDAAPKQRFKDTTKQTLFHGNIAAFCASWYGF